MWMVVYIAQNEAIADNIKDLLSREGFLVKLKPIYKNVSSGDNYYQVLVPQSEADEVHDILMEQGF